MTTNNHPAHGPVSLDRLHQISEILSKAAAQSDGGNLGYAMADAVKVIDGAIAAFVAEPVAYMYKDKLHTDARFSLDTRFGNWSQEDINEYEITEIPLYAAPPAPLVDWVSLGDSPYDVPYSMPSNLRELIAEEIGILFSVDDAQSVWNVCRSAAMLQAGNSPELPDCWIPVSERMPERDVDVQVYCTDKKEQMVGYLERSETEGWFRFASLPNGGGVYCKPTHWMPLPAAPQQEVK